MKEFKLIKILAHSFFLFLFLFAACYYIERMLYSDSSFYTFKILCFEKFNIEAGRYSAFLTQILPLIFVKLNAGLRTVMVSYSVSFIVIYYLIFLVCMYVFSSLKAGLAATFVLFLGISDCSLYPITELQLGMLSTVMFYGFLEYYFQHESRFPAAKKILFILIGAAIILVCLFSHPSTLFPVLFVLIFQLIDKQIYRNKAIYILILIAIIAYGIKFLSVDTNSYEGHQMEPLKNLVAILKNFTNINSVYFFMKFVLKGVYVLPILLFIISLGYYAVKREYLKFAYTGIATIGFFILLMVVFSPGDSDVGMEKNIIPLWIFVTIPFIHDVLFQKFRHTYLRSIIYVGVVILGLAGFYRATVIYGDRIHYMKQIIEISSETLDSGKIIIEKKNLNQYRLGSTWSFANETLLLSSLKGPEHATTVFLVDDLNQLNDFDLQVTDVYLCVPFWLQWNYNSLNQRYFQLPDEPYKIMISPIPGN